MSRIGRKLKDKKFLMGATVLVVVFIVLGFLGWMKYGTGTESSNQLLAVDQVLAIAMAYEDRGDIDGGLAYYDSQIKGRKDSGEQQRLLLYKSGFALQSERYDEAVNAAKQADAIKSNMASMMALANAYEAKGDKRQAISYYKKLVDSSPKSGLGPRSVGEWEQKIKELES